MDQISITDLEIWTHIGITEEERSTEQCLTVSVQMHTDTTKCAQTDDVSHTIDYDSVCKDILRIAKQERNTIETFAQDAATMILDTYKPGGGVEVVVKKFVIPGTESVSVRITRSKEY